MIRRLVEASLSLQIGCLYVCRVSGVNAVIVADLTRPPLNALEELPLIISETPILLKFVVVLASRLTCKARSIGDSVGSVIVIYVFSERRSIGVRLVSISIRSLRVMLLNWNSNFFVSHWLIILSRWSRLSCSNRVVI